MRKIIIITATLGCLSGCKLSEHSHQPGGPYYFKSGVTYQGYRPTGEITQSQAEQIASDGYAHYIAYFNQDGQATKILKVYKGETNLYMQLEVDTNDIQRCREYIDEKRKEEFR